MSPRAHTWSCVLLTAEDRKVGPWLCALGKCLGTTIPTALDAFLPPFLCLSRGIATGGLLVFVLD